jgi:hypothetical protein
MRVLVATPHDIASRHESCVSITGIEQSPQIKDSNRLSAQEQASSVFKALELLRDTFAKRPPRAVSRSRFGARQPARATPSPICVPAREALATGRRVFETGHWDNTSPYAGEPRGWAMRCSAAAFASKASASRTTEPRRIRRGPTSSTCPCTSWAASSPKEKSPVLTASCAINTGDELASPRGNDSPPG